MTLPEGYICMQSFLMIIFYAHVMMQHKLTIYYKLNGSKANNSDLSILIYSY